jgi:hypothetical protein
MPPPPHPDNASRNDYSDAECEFILAMERYKRETRRRFPSWHEVLGVLKSLGYRKVEMTNDGMTNDEKSS